MATVLLFITILAWVGFVCAFALAAFRIYGGMTYTPLEEALDRVKGRIVTFPIGRPLVIIIVCGAWLIASWGK